MFLLENSVPFGEEEGMLERAETTRTIEDHAVSLTDNARVVLMKRYVRRGPDGQPAETPEGMFKRCVMPR